MKQIAPKEPKAPDLATVGGRIWAVRESRKKSQTELATSAGMKQPSLWAIENNDTKEITAIRLGRIARILKCSWEYLLFGDEYGQGKEDAEAEAELIGIFRSLPPPVRVSVLGSVRMLRDSIPEPTPSPPPDREYQRVMRDSAAKVKVPKNRRTGT